MRPKRIRQRPTMLAHEWCERRALQALVTEWALESGGSGYEEARSVVRTDDNGFVVVGWSNGAKGSKNEDVLVTRIAADHSVVWSRLVGGSGRDRGYSITQADDGFLVGGMTGSFGHRQQCYLVRLDFSGAVLWEKAFGTRRSSGIRSLCPASDGGFVATGWTGMRRNDDSDDLLLFKIDSGGALDWWREYAEPAWQLGHEVLASPDGGFVIAGIARRRGAGTGARGLDGRVTKTNDMGDIEWTVQTFRPGWDEWHGIVSADDGYVVSGGVVFGGMAHTQMMRIDTQGVVRWARIVSETGYSWHVCRDGADGFVAVGAAYAPAPMRRGGRASDLSTFVLVLDRDGILVDVGYFGGPFHDAARYVLPTPSGGFAVVGYIGKRRGAVPSSNRQPPWDRDMWTYEVRR